MKNLSNYFQLEYLKKWLWENRYFFIIFGILFSVYILWWLAFYPGTLSPDSISQWKEATKGHFTNASPFLYAYIFSFLIKILYSPSAMGLFQLFLLSIIVSLFLNYAVKNKLPKKYAFMAVFLYIFMPQFGIYNVTIWKDVLYAYAFLLLLLFTYLAVTQEKILKNISLFVAFAFIISLAPLMRFNGLFVIPFVPLLLFIIKKIDYKKSIALFLLSFFFLFFV